MANSIPSTTKKGLLRPLFALVFLLLCSLTIQPAFAKIEFSDKFLNKIEKKYGDYAKRRLVSWEKLIKESQDIPEDQKLEKVNIFFNLLIFMSDIRHWSQEDYWATPLELLVSGKGDCEDFSIAKYFTLRELNVADEKLLITYVKALNYNQAHMVLTYYKTPESIPLVLDNLIGEIKPATERNDLAPVYSFNGQGLWLAKQRGKGKKLGDSDDVDRWADMLDRMEEGSIGEFK